MKENYKLHLKRTVILSIIILGLLASSCKSTRSIIKSPIKEQGPEYLFEKLEESELKYDWFSAKTVIDYTYNKKITHFKAQIRMRKDSIIWISFSPALGIEIARILITNDSVKFLNRMNKTYFLGDYQFVNDFLETNIDFDILQSFIIGNDFQFYDKSSFRASIDGGEYRMVTNERSKLKKYIKQGETDSKIFIQHIWLNPENFKITRSDIKEIKKENKKLIASYNDFGEINEQLFPYSLNFDVHAEEYNIKIDVDYSRISIDQELKFPFSLPSKYKQIY